MNPISQRRKVERFESGSWTQIDFLTLRKDDLFCLINFDGSIVKDEEHKFVFQCTEDAYINEEYVPTVNCIGHG